MFIDFLLPWNRVFKDLVKCANKMGSSNKSDSVWLQADLLCLLSHRVYRWWIKSVTCSKEASLMLSALLTLVENREC